MANLEKLKMMIDEENYPYFTDEYLQNRLDTIEAEGLTFNALVKELCLIKSGIEEMKLGDITIPSPRRHFMMLAQRYRMNNTGVVTRADGS